MLHWAAQNSVELYWVQFIVLVLLKYLKVVNSIKYINFNLHVIFYEFFFDSKKPDCHLMFLQVKQLLCFKSFYDACNKFVIILPASLKYLFTWRFEIQVKWICFNWRMNQWVIPLDLPLLIGFFCLSKVH